MMKNKIKCDKCNCIAVWRYMPSDGVGDFCDECVSRGCSCNRIVEEFDIDGIEPPPGWEPKQYTDELGRELPCCEFDYNAEGFDHEDYD